MPFIQLWDGTLAKVHIVSNRVKTMCGRPIPSNATETTKPPRDQAKICKACRKIEQEEKRYQRILK